MARMFAEIIPQSMTLTGTLMAGYARDLFYLLYGFGDREIRDDFGHRDSTRWRNQYGFVERTVYLESGNAKRSRTKKQDERPKDLPGAMPAVLRYILGHSGVHPAAGRCGWDCLSSASTPSRSSLTTRWTRRLASTSATTTR